MSMKGVRPNPKSTYHQGYYDNVQNPHKYGSSNKTIIYRSGLELKFCIHCDTNPDILLWVSEPESIQIYYYHPFKKRIARYYVDYYVKKKVDGGSVREFLIEVKPESFLSKPKPPPYNATKKQLLNYQRKLQACIIVRAKFLAAEEYCKTRNFTYIFLTEKWFNSQ